MGVVLELKYTPSDIYMKNIHFITTYGLHLIFKRNYVDTLDVFLPFSDIQHKTLLFHMTDKDLTLLTNIPSQAHIHIKCYWIKEKKFC